MQIVLLAASTVCATVPMMSFLAAVWWLDRYDREPTWLLALVFGWGAVGAVMLAIPSSLLIIAVLTAALHLVGEAGLVDLGPLLPFVGPGLTAPLVEEPAKGLILLGIIWSRHFDNMTDGFVYGTAAGLGFAMTENFLYFVSASSDAAAWGGVVVVRTLFSATMHASASAVLGAALGWARFRGPVQLVAAGMAGLGLAMGVHAVWNGLLVLGETSGWGGAYAVDLLLLPLEALALFVVFELCVWEESYTIRRQLTEEADNGVIPEDHPRILGSFLRRAGRRWVPEGVEHDAYVRTATQLAMRKQQLAQLGSRADPFYAEEIGRLRRRLQVLLTV